MSRLDSFIRRLQAQRICLEFAAQRIAGLPGVVLELGLGNGRTYDHLRELLPDREIFVLDRQVAAHPDCIPDAEHLILGAFSATLLPTVARFAGRCALVHADIGSGQPERDRQVATLLGSGLPPALTAGGIVLCDQALASDALRPLALPDGVADGRYHAYQRPSTAP